MKKKIILMLFVGVLLTGCFFDNKKQDNKDDNVLYETKNLTIEEFVGIANDSTNEIELRKYSQKTDEQGQNILGRVFNLKNGTNNDIKYQILLKANEKNTIGFNKIKYILNKSYGKKELGTPKITYMSEIKNNILDSDTIPKNSQYTYSIRIWLDDQKEIAENDTASFEIIIEETK
jgi:hypothetical protein